jgi:hypothetical protein
MDPESAFSIILAAAGSVTAVGFIAKLFTNTLTSIAIKKFDLVNAKALEEQKLSHNKDLEEIKSQMNKLQKEHEIVFSSLYAKRESVVINLYKLMSEFALLVENKLKVPDTSIDYKCNELIEYFDLNRLYFPQEVALEINHVLNIASKLVKYQNIEEYQQLAFNLKIHVYDHMELTFRELLKVEDYR